MANTKESKIKRVFSIFSQTFDELAGLSFKESDFKRVISQVNDQTFLDKGAFGDIYGPFTINKKDCVVKRITFGAEKVDDEIQRKYDNKKSTWMSLKHKNLIEIYCVNVTSRVLYIVMEYARGGSLRKTLNSCGSIMTLSIKVVTDWGRQIAEGMEYLHTNNIVHRDLKSSNIVLMERFCLTNVEAKNTLKIVDFDDMKEHHQTITMSFRGTCAWMAPEIVTTHRFSKASDVWSYGIVLWEMVTGEIPYKNETETAIMLKVAHQQLVHPVIPDETPQQLKKLILACLQSNTKTRPAFERILKHYKGNTNEYQADFGDNWPLRKRETDTLKKNRTFFIDSLEAKEVVDSLYSANVLNKRQKEQIFLQRTCREQNDALFDIISQSTLHNYKKINDCLIATKQEHIATVLNEGGVVVPVHAELSEYNGNVDEAEEKIVLQMRNVLKAKIKRRVSELSVIAVRKGNSVTLYSYSKILEEFLHFEKQLKSGTFQFKVGELFSYLLSVNVKRNVILRWKEPDLSTARNYFNTEIKDSSTSETELL